LIGYSFDRLLILLRIIGRSGFQSTLEDE